MRFEMQHTAILTEDGLIHVQNIVGNLFGQHHVHTKKGFKNWLVNIAKSVQPVPAVGKCNCGLAAGDVREFDGKVWHNDRFAA